MSEAKEQHKLPPFDSAVPDGECLYTHDTLGTMQVNIGRMCNLACRHCHLSCGPSRTEMMSRGVMDECISAAVKSGVKVIDITGGAPEMHPHFREFLKAAAGTGAHVIVRTNLVILDEDGYRDIPELYALYRAEVVGSLPYYSAKDNDRMRGDGVFMRSVNVLKRLNELGYGRQPELALDLVYNPGGAFLPPSQSEFEKEYREHLAASFGLSFTHLFTITNNPIGRFRDFLVRSGNYDGYMNRLYDAFNPVACRNIMCRDQISVGWDGRVYDCDFNQALELPAVGAQTISEWAAAPCKRRRIATGPHCYACTAGAGSSCGGSTQ